MEPWLAHAAAAFWKEVGRPPAYPRGLEEALPLAYPVACLSLPGLSVAEVQQWLNRQDIRYQLLCQDRSLSGCVVAARGKALVFTRKEDSDADRRFTVAHEFAHFLLDYLQPRQKAVHALGPAVLEVLDGDRSPTMEERLSAALDNINLGVYFNLMPRADNGAVNQGHILRAETQADRLALELIAPARSVQTHIARISDRDLFRRRAAAADILKDHYGLPAGVAGRYATLLVKSQVRSTAEWLGLA